MSARVRWRMGRRVGAPSTNTAICRGVHHVRIDHPARDTHTAGHCDHIDRPMGSPAGRTWRPEQRVDVAQVDVDGIDAHVVVGDPEVRERNVEPVLSPQPAYAFATSGRDVVRR